MKTHVTAFFLTSLLAAMTGCGNGVDLASDFERATSHLSGVSAPRGWDGSVGFSQVKNQAPLGACQTFAMTALMEYVYFMRTGHVIDLSEKYLAYNLLRHFITANWNEAEGKFRQAPSLGQGVDPHVIRVLAQAGLMPESSYPWGNLASDQNLHVDVDAFRATFENPRDILESRDAYFARLDEAMLAPPPARFFLQAQWLDMVLGQETSEVIRTPQELLAFLGVSRESFLFHVNREVAPSMASYGLEEGQVVAQWFAEQAKANEVRFVEEGREDIRKTIIDQLKRHMVVNVAMEVWKGDWGQDVVLKGGGGHAMVIVGYQERDGKMFFKLRNSWGPGLGRDGYNVVPADLLLKNAYAVTTVELE